MVRTQSSLGRRRTPGRTQRSARSSPSHASAHSSKRRVGVASQRGRGHPKPHSHRSQAACLRRPKTGDSRWTQKTTRRKSCLCWKSTRRVLRRRDKKCQGKLRVDCCAAGEARNDVYLAFFCRTARNVLDLGVSCFCPRAVRAHHVSASRVHPVPVCLRC